MRKKILWCSILAWAAGSLLLAACQPPAAAGQNQAASSSQTLTIYDWELDLPQAVLDRFQKETGISVMRLTYETQQEAIEHLRAGRQYDLVVMDSRFVPRLAESKLLARIDARQVENLKNVSPAYRDELYGLKDRYAIPFNWGSTGIIVRPDLVSQPVTHWADLWDERFRGKIGIWKEQPREVIAIALKTLGYSANSEDPAELQAALLQLKKLRWSLVFMEDYAQINAGSPLGGGDLVVGIGYAEDVWNGEDQGLELRYIYPEEGALLWGDTFILPASSQNPDGAYAFLNFVLRPEVSAMITNQIHYAAPIELAREFIDPELLKDPVVFPDPALLVNAELIRPLSKDGEALYEDIWNQFLAVSRE